MHIFYGSDINSHFNTLSEQESKHCIKVLRLKFDDEIVLIDGKGGYYKAKITDPNPKHCAVEIIEEHQNFGKRDYKLSIAIAPTKNINRFETFLEKSCEIGINTIEPILCRYSERKVIKSDRLNKVILSAVKQSVKAYLPALSKLSNFKEIVKQNYNGKKFIAHCYDTQKYKLKDTYKKGENALILIGPEGDFSQEEVDMAEKNGFISVSLSKSRLRTETAGIIACSIIDFINN